MACSPGGRAVPVAEVILDLVGEVGDQLGSLRQIGAPNRMVMQEWWNARKPGQRTRVGWRERCETPVEDGGDIVCCSEVASAGGCQQVAEWVFIGFGGEGEQVGSKVGQAGSAVSPGM
jgi:hypothetical protein